MDFDANYRLLGVVNTTELLDQANQVTKSQWYPKSVGKRPLLSQEMQTIKVFGITGSSHLKMQSQFQLALVPVLKFLDRLDPKGQTIRCMLARLQPKCIVRAHVDESKENYGRTEGFMYTEERRIHLPLITNDDVIFSVDGETKHLGVGELWEINNKRVHGVRNDGKTPRVHLIIDRTVS